MQEAVETIDCILLRIAEQKSKENNCEESKEISDVKNTAIKEHNVNLECFDSIDKLINDKTLQTVLTHLGHDTLTPKNFVQIQGVMTGKIFQESASAIKQMEDQKAKLCIKQYIQSSVETFFQPKLLQIKDQQSVKISPWMKRIWTKYSSIENKNTRVLESFHQYGLDSKDIDWCITEKVHGANFAILYNGKEFGAATRNSLLEEMSKFFIGWMDVVEQEKSHLIKAYELLQHKNPKYTEIAVYGEFFGGLYEHTDAKYTPEKGTKHIQIGVNYSPSLHFYAFDIKTNFIANEDTKAEEKEKHQSHPYVKLPFHEALDIFKQCGFLYCEPIQCGTLEECVAFDVETFKSTIPSKLGLPEPENADGSLCKNIAEGVVLRKLYGKNVRLKIKASAFFEVTNQKHMAKRNRNAQKSKKKSSLEDIKRKGMKEKNIDAKYFDFIDRCVNENKFETVKSKVGPLSLSNCRQMSGRMVGDVLKDLKYEYLEIIKVDKLLKEYCQCAVGEFFAPKLYNLQM